MEHIDTALHFANNMGALHGVKENINGVMYREILVELKEERRTF